MRFGGQHTFFFKILQRRQGCFSLPSVRRRFERALDGSGEAFCDEAENTWYPSPESEIFLFFDSSVSAALTRIEGVGVVS